TVSVIDQLMSLTRLLVALWQFCTNKSERVLTVLPARVPVGIHTGWVAGPSGPVGNVSIRIDIDLQPQRIPAFKPPGPGQVMSMPDIILPDLGVPLHPRKLEAITIARLRLRTDVARAVVCG